MTVKRIAMWSGPRNLSTAMMYSFAQRNDCQVIDEPLYAAYLDDTGLQHAMAEEVIAHGETDAQKVIDAICHAEIDQPLQYQKHITKHLLPEYGMDWLADLTNVFLIRHPARVICSYHLKDENPGLSDIGVQEQWQIYERAKQLGQNPIVIDSADILANPEASLKGLCASLGIKFQAAMLHWPAGPKSYDGIWAPHWYQSVWKSEGFASTPGPLPAVAPELQPLLEQAMPYYDRLRALC
jgi:hypothetical protein